jgi:hypothetical protein
VTPSRVGKTKKTPDGPTRPAGMQSRSGRPGHTSPGSGSGQTFRFMARSISPPAAAAEPFERSGSPKATRASPKRSAVPTKPGSTMARVPSRSPPRGSNAVSGSALSPPRRAVPSSSPSNLTKNALVGAMRSEVSDIKSSSPPRSPGRVPVAACASPPLSLATATGGYSPAAVDRMSLGPQVSFSPNPQSPPRLQGGSRTYHM